MGRWLTVVVAGVVIVVVVVAAARVRARAQRAVTGFEARFQLDFPGGDVDWIRRRFIARDLGGLSGIALGAVLAVGVALVVNPTFWTPLLAMLCLSSAGCWVGQTLSETWRAKIGSASRRLGEFFPPAALGLIMAMRLLPVATVAVGFACGHPFAAVVTAALQLGTIVMAAVTRHRSLRGRGFGLTRAGAQWAAALHADALRLQYLAESSVLGLGTTMVGFYCYEYADLAGEGLTVPLVAAAGSAVLALVASAAVRAMPRWSRTHAWTDEPDSY